MARTRPSWDDYFLRLAGTVAERATCPRASVGCVLVRDHRILSTGYNGAVCGDAHCDDDGCLLVDGHCKRTVHAEANALVQAALHGVQLDGAVSYQTHSPCVDCAKLLINAGISIVVYTNDYVDPLAERLLAESGVTLKHAQPQTEENFSLELRDLADLLDLHAQQPDVAKRLRNIATTLAIRHESTSS
jgi:dCMP deaminase